MFIYVCVCVRVSEYVGGDGSLYVCMCVREKVIPDRFWTKPPEGDKETHLEPEFGDWTNMYELCVCVRVSQDTPTLEPVIEPLEEECVSLLYIHHLSSLRSHRPSCRTLLSCCI